MTHSRPSSVSEPAGSQPAFRKTVRIATLAGSVEASTASAAFRVLPIVRIHGPKVTLALASRDGANAMP